MAKDSRADTLQNVLWIGGSVCAGKTSAATMLADRYSLRRYHFDRQEPLHIERRVTERHPYLTEFMAMTMDQRWVLRSPEEMAQHTIGLWSEERFPMVIDDLIAMNSEGAIVAEGAGLFPEKVAPLLTDRRAAIWLVATAACIRRIRRVRGEGVTRSTSDPERAFENLVARDTLMAQHVRREAEARGLTVVEIEAEVITGAPAIVESHFAPLLHRLV